MNIDHQESLEAEVERLRDRVTELAAALRFYADPSTYVEGNKPHPREFATYVTPINEDKGERAALALAGDGDGAASFPCRCYTQPGALHSNPSCPRLMRGAARC